MRKLSARISEDIFSSIHAAANTSDALDVVGIAEQVRRRNEVDNVALEDLVSYALTIAQSTGRPIIFASNATEQGLMVANNACGTFAPHDREDRHP